MKHFTRPGLGIAAALLLTASAAAPAFASPGQEVVDLDTTTAQHLVERLVGDDTEISNVSYLGAPAAAGFATGMAGGLGIDEGVVLSTGRADVVVGPNTQPGAGTSNGTPGDADLDALVPQSRTEDAAVLEFDFVPSAPEVTFTYVFGSEEYLEYVDSEFNDVFGFYVNGVNYATIPTADGPVAVSVNNVNHKTNTGYFVDNSDTEAPTRDTELDGLTVELTFTAPVNVGETNRMKLAVADVSDRILDTAVIIKAGSFKANTPPVAADVTTTTPFDTPVDITLDGTDADGDALTYEIVDGPDAAQGTLSVVSGAGVTFTPAAGFTGTAQFTYRANDGAATSNVATVTVTVAVAGETPEPTETPIETPIETPAPTETAAPTATTAPTPPVLAATGADGVGLIAAIGAGLALAGGLLVARRAMAKH